MSFSGSAAAQIRGHFDRTLKVSGSVTLSVTSGSGSVAVTAGDDASVRVVGTIRGTTRRGEWSDSDVERAVRTIEAKPPIVQNGSTIGLGAIDDEELRQRVSISWEVTVPKRTALTAKTGSGSVQIAALAGPVNANSGSGSITIGAIDSAVDVRTGSGSIRVDGARDRLNASSGSGEVRLGAISGKVAIDTGSGSISVSKAAEATVDVSTGSGEIAITDLSGGVTAKAASGSIHITGTPTADWQLHSSSGSIVLGIPLGTAFRVQANTSSGSIDTDHKLTITHAGRRELTGTVGAGGVLVDARTSSGSIRIGR
jgi:DUF4097 and DUF4098 domain-containing protein YvlB